MRPPETRLCYRMSIERVDPTHREERAGSSTKSFCHDTGTLPGLTSIVYREKQKSLYGSFVSECSVDLVRIRYLLGGMFGNIQQDSHSNQKGNQRRPTVAHEWKGYSGEGKDIQIYADIYECLGQEPERYPYCGIAGKEVFRMQPYLEGAISDNSKHRQEHQNPEETEFFGNYGEDKVSLYFRKVSELLDRFSESETEESPASDRDEPLFGLKIDGLVLDGSLVIRKEGIHTLGNVRHLGRTSAHLPYSVYPDSEYGTYESAQSQVFEISTGHEEHSDCYWGYQEDRTEVRLQHQEKHHGSQQAHIRHEPIGEVSDNRLLSFQIRSKVEYDPEFCKLDRLQGKRQERNVDPPLGTVISYPDEEYGHKHYKGSQKNMLGVFFENRIRGFCHECKSQKPDKHVGNISE